MPSDVPSSRRELALIASGGSGRRMQAGQPKQFLELGGIPVLQRTLAVFAALPYIRHVVLVAPPEHLAASGELLTAALAEHPEVNGLSVAGGSDRTTSVWNGLRAIDSLAEENALVAIHDGVRPLIRPARIEAAFRSAREQGSGVCCVPVKSSLRRETAPGESRPLPREGVFHVQTPQCFRLREILAAYEAQAPGRSFTDDASLFEAAGGQVAIVPGDYDNLKLTTPEDLILAAHYLRQQAAENEA